VGEVIGWAIAGGLIIPIAIKTGLLAGDILVYEIKRIHCRFDTKRIYG
jgi:hypothetical protein